MNSQVKAYIIAFYYILEDGSPQLRMKCMHWKNAGHFVSFILSPSAKRQNGIWHQKN